MLKRVLFLTLALVFLVSCGEYQPAITGEPMDVEITKAILERYEDADPNADCYGVGHVVMGTESKEGSLYAYILFDHSVYKEKDGAMCRISGTGITPAVAVMDEETFAVSELKLIGVGDITAVEQLVPMEYHERIYSIDIDDFTAITNKSAAMVSDYLKANKKQMEIKY